MDKATCVVAVFPDHASAETAVKKLMSAGFDVKDLSLVGKGFHTEETIVGPPISPNVGLFYTSPC